MTLQNIKIGDFLSIRRPITIALDPAVSILLGANDHGKSNILTAIEHLNDDRPILQDEVNWDAERVGGVPELTYSLRLNPQEKIELASVLEKLVVQTEPGNSGDEDEGEEDADNEEQDDDGEDEVETEWPTDKLVSLKLLLGSCTDIVLVRTGVGSQLTLDGNSLDALPKVLSKWLADNLPRVELFKNLGDIQDSVTSSEIATDSFDFLQGVFYYAGLNPMSCSPLFIQSDATERDLDDASQRLDAELRKLWMQGTDLGLHFELRHRGNSIDFRANDPSVTSRKTRMSKRSTGVTQFFRISMVLHARRRKHPANSYIYLFDEPGVFLHPKGQKDLMQVFEELSSEAQLCYTTHSLFLLNQNFPERHRLILRGKDGTVVDQKPYRANWRLATDALGISLTSNIIFSSKVLLVEGDSDPIHLYELFRSLNRLGEIDADANALGILSFSDLPNLRLLLQVFKRDQDSRVAVLVDGDKQGKNTVANIRKLCERLAVPSIELEKDQSIENYALRNDLLLEATIDAITEALKAEEKAIPSELRKTVESSWFQHLTDRKVSTGKWFKDLSKIVVGDEASKVAWARNYVFRSRADSKQSEDLPQRVTATELCKQIASHLDLPKLRAQCIVDLES